MSINKAQTGVNSIELYTEWFLGELKDHGYVEAFYREPYKLQTLPKANYQRYSFSKTKFSVEEYSLLREDNYTFDYMIVWTAAAEDIFYTLLDGTPTKGKTPFYAFKNQEGQVVSLIDVKPPAGAFQVSGALASGRDFSLQQKLLWYIHGIYVNKTVPIPMVSKGEVKSGNAVALFTACFCPERYRFTDGGKQIRKINFHTRTMKQYVDIKQKELYQIRALLNSQNNLFDGQHN